MEATRALVDAFARCDRVVTAWTSAPSYDSVPYWEPPEARAHRAALRAIAAACLKVRYSERDGYIRARLIAAYASLALLTFGLGILIAWALE